jgi:protein-tyrosine phosphatase
VTFLFQKIGSFPLFIGPYPQHRADAEALARERITAVFNVQTQSDIEHRRINLEEMKRAYESLGILHVRCPIEDFSGDSLRLNLLKANEKLRPRARTLHVHCTAGIGRTPAVIALLKLPINLSYEDARRVVYESHPIIAPN